MNLIDKITATFLIILLFPVWGVLFFLMEFFNKEPFVFKQRRMGKNKKIFTIYKIRTMGVDAEDRRKDLSDLNEAQLPAFKIKDDPRYTPLGRFLSQSSLDESLQLINVLKGEMSLVGPRPLPVEEAKKTPGKYNLRFSVLPGITSSAVIKGNHWLSFHRWMESDLTDIKMKSFSRDWLILFSTFLLVVT